MRKKYFKKQRFLETFDKFAQALFFQIPLGIPIVGFLLFGTITIAFNKDILAKIDTLGPVESFLRYSEYSIGIANLCLTTITVILIVYTLYLTKRANKKQFFETRFFDLLNIHRENTVQVESGNISGRKVFEKIFNEFKYISDFVKSKFPEVTPHDNVTISYLSVFWGLTDTKGDLEKYLEKHYKTIDNNNLLFELTKLHSNINQHESVSPLRGAFTGHQLSLSHYFRHLFQTFQFINKQSYLSIDEKYQYAKTLRAQLSNLELVIFFFNSISPLGATWELNQKEFRNKLITKYQLIKNIPFSLITDIDVKTYYPDIEFESEE
ncbi:MAG: hypothetical protein OJF59_000636 [Cytophagales bacterium]|jgi:hypothetical protein|nr:putative phage abortive infection protein [Bacteroidota bacterium]MBS1558341.1 putative phage abortive infection protein [Bacteroidota bacterium]MBS1981361.1 putative phage abortive infection protein [Bacteroidota bacterium]WHZ06883.1 MAG: hypothetical protein OJF59_000636 [Cytophagales bacterium]